MEDNPSGEAFLNASASGNAEIVREYLKRGEDVDASDGDGWTPLHLASINGRVKVVKQLLEARCHKEAQTKNGSTPLHLASSGGHNEIVKLLLEARCNQEAQDRDGSTPLHCASSIGRLGAVKLLLDAQCNEDAQTKNGWTPLHLASRNGHVEVVQLLLEARCNKDAQDEDGWTPLHYASRDGHVEVVKRLLGANCSLHLIDNSGRMPLHVAIASVGRYGQSRSADDDTLGVLQALVLYGTEWDEKCEMMVASGEAMPEASALKLCIDLWEHERKNEASLTEIPLQTIQRGVGATRTYIRELLNSKVKLLRSKLGIIGASNSGKTSFSKSIISLMSSLEHIDNRTVAIDHYPHLFKHGDKSCEFTIWDFAGQDVYQPVHAMFFTRRTIYIMCIDMHSYGVALKQATLLADYDSQVDHFMDEVVDKKILKWIRLIIARQSDAEFVFVATKADKVDANSRHAKAARSDLEKRLKQYVSQTSEELQQALSKSQKPDGTDRTITESRGFSAKQLEKLQATIRRLLQHEWVSVSCVDAESIKAARTKIEEVVVASKCSLFMPESYVAAREFVRGVRSQSPSRDALSRVQSTFVNADVFVKRLHDNRPDVDIDTYRVILRTLHDLGDVLWYEDLGIERLKHEVILDPMLLIDFIRPIADHKFTSEVMTHDSLKSKPLWLHLNQDFMLTMKQLLREFNLVYIRRQAEMQWNSDLLVPASWRSNIPSSLRFGGQLLSYEFTEMAKQVQTASKRANRLAITANVQWEYHFLSLLPESVFDQIVIASYNPLDNRQVGPDWILYHNKGVFAYRIIISRHRTTKERTIRLEAVAGVPRKEQRELWELFERLCVSLERVLRCFGGLIISRHVLKDSGEMLNLDEVVDGWLETKMVVPWLPPKMDWYDELRKEAET